MMVKQLCDEAEMTISLKARVLSGAVPSDFVVMLPKNDNETTSLSDVTGTFFLAYDFRAPFTVYFGSPVMGLARWHDKNFAELSNLLMGPRKEKGVSEGA